MSKILVLLLLLAAALSGCSPAARQDTAPLQQPFELTADCTGSFSGSVLFWFHSPEEWELVFRAPQNAAGLTFRQSGGVLTAAQGVLQSPVHPEVLPQHSAIRALSRAGAVCASAAPKRQPDGSLLYAGEDLEVLCQNGAVAEIRCRTSGAVFAVTGFQLLTPSSD